MIRPGRTVPWTMTAVIAAAALASAQEPARTLDLRGAVARAAASYPGVTDARARAAAASGGIGVARTAYLPRLDLLWQENRATTNNVFGLLLPQSVVPPISGPVLGTTSLGGSVWGSAGGMLLSWEALDFGQRAASVDLARAQARAADAQASAATLAAQVTAADAFLSVVAAGEGRRAAAANVDRLEVFARAVHALVDNQLRPGAEASRADAELAAARTALARADEQDALSRASLAEAIGDAGQDVAVAAGPLLDLPPDTAAAPPAFDAHPAAQAQAGIVQTVEAREQIVRRSTYPHVTLQSALSGRGSGAKVSESTFEGSGWWLQVPNWAAGVTVTVPAFEVFGARARARVEASTLAAEQAKYRQTIQSLQTQEARARALVAAARRIAANTPVELAAAREAESRARARYDAGLASITEVADAQRLLAQAESDDALARVAVWRALLAQASARGDLAPFLARLAP